MESRWKEGRVGHVVDETPELYEVHSPDLGRGLAVDCA